MCCFAAERLVGRVLRRYGGRRWLLLDPCSAASLANLSAASFPTEPMCPAIHLSLISSCGSSAGMNRVGPIASGFRS